MTADRPAWRAWDDVDANPLDDLRRARRLIEAELDEVAPSARTAVTHDLLVGMPTDSVRDLYLTGEGAGVARALGVPVYRVPDLRYGTVVEDRTTGELRLLVGTLRTFDDVLAAVRREAAGIALTVLTGYGEPAYHHRRRRQLDAERLLEELAGQAVAEAR